MPKFNIDEDKSLNEPIEFVLDGKTYRIDSLKPDHVRRIQSEMQTANELTDVGAVNARHLALLTGAAAEEFADADVRKSTAAIAFVMACVTEVPESVKKKAIFSR